ncbi:MAG: hypothetical protein B6I36_09865 [Desulfobacteraceae bacterium 4572_35.1]|nr:MAG: hypothetical protein B6I36_09865 [Desulfobacteraceae bacterium 4572_35.1]
MANVERTGSVYTDTATGTANNDLTCTVPTDAEAAIVVGGGNFYNAANFNILNFDAGVTIDFDEIITNSNTNNGTQQAYSMLDTDINWPGSGSKTLKWSIDDTANWITVLFFVKNIDKDSLIVDTSSGYNDPGTYWENPSLSGMTAADLAIAAAFIYSYNSGSVDADPTSYGQTAIYESSSGSDSMGIGEELGEDVLRLGFSNADDYFGAIAFGIKAKSLSLTQEGYRVRNDDGSETTATWKAAQDTPATGVSASQNVRLRVIVDAEGDAPSQTYKLQYKRNGDAASEWRDLPEA